MKIWDAQVYQKAYGYVWKAAEDLIALLSPQAGERILDLGSGTGEMTNKISESGALVMGLDHSSNMIREARLSFPQLTFIEEDARAFELESPVDAVFSNAALHWIPEAKAVVGQIHRALKPGGRFVAEFGGHGNVQAIHSALEHSFRRLTHKEPPRCWYFPTMSQYTSLLESQGMEVTLAILFDRPTPLGQNETAIPEWVRMFGSAYLSEIPFELHPEFLEQVKEETRPTLFKDSQWFADYRRLRVVAHRR